MSDNSNMIVVSGVRYRYEDALRLGLVDKGTVAAQASVKHPARTDAPIGLLTTVAASLHALVETKDATSARPSKTGKKDDWVAFALANGKTEEELDGLKRDDIVALFPAE